MSQYAEKALKNSETQYWRIIENLQDAYFRADNEGNIIRVNPSAALMYGFISSDEMIGIPVISLYKNPEDRNFILEELKKEGKVVNFEVEGLKKNGASFWVSMNAQFYSDDQGQIQGIDSLVHDITEYKLGKNRINKQNRLYATISRINQALVKKAEVKIKDREELFKDICEICVELGKFQMAWIGLIDQETGDIKPVAYYGYEDGFLEKFSINIQEEPSADNPVIMTITKGELIITKNIEKKLNIKWREEYLKRNYHSSASIPLKLKGEIIGLLNIYSSEPNFFTEKEIHLVKEMVLDISFVSDSIKIEKERKISATSLVEMKKKYREFVDNSMVGVFSTNLEGDILYANNAMAKMLHFDNVEDLKHINVIRLYKNPEDRTLFLQKLKGDGRVNNYEIELLGKHGEIVNVILGATISDEVLSGMFMDITRQKKAEKKLKSSLHDKEILLREIHHRVKNNMQIISSLLNLQKLYVEDEEAFDVLKECQNRVKTMAMIHEKLYQSKKISNIPISDYIENIVKDLFYSYSIKKGIITPILKIDDINLNIETAAPCGLIITELVSNSLKYAFPEGRKGKVQLSLKAHDNGYELAISDNGIGLPEDFDYKNTKSLGLQLVNILVLQIDGEITLDRSQGTEFKIIFKELQYSERGL